MDNGVEEYRWLVTLDNRTCEICAYESTQKYKVGEGPVPPAHPNCRCVTVEILPDKWKWLAQGRQQASQFGPVDSGQSYYGWLKTQDPKYIREVLGPSRAKLLMSGSINADKFARLQLDKNFKPQSLAEMQAQSPAVFNKANVELNPITGYPIEMTAA